MAVEVSHDLAPQGWLVVARIMRIHQWSKNLLVFAPMVLSGRYDGPTLLRVLAGFVSLSLAASALYVINDLIDVDRDRAHPLKRLRPVAAGHATPASALAIGAASAAASLGLAAVLGASAVLAVAAYAVCSLSYQVLWKHLLLADVLMLAVLYSFRLYAGGVYAQVEISDWLIVFAVFFFLGLAVMKRLVDLANRDPALPVPDTGYRPQETQLLQTFGITASMTSFAVLALYVFSERSRAIYAHPELLWGVWLVVFYCVGRLWFSIGRGEVKEDPVTYVLRARYCQLSIVLALLLMWVARHP